MLIVIRHFFSTRPNCEVSRELADQKIREIGGGIRSNTFMTMINNARINVENGAIIPDDCVTLLTSWLDSTRPLVSVCQRTLRSMKLFDGNEAPIRIPTPAPSVPYITYSSYADSFENTKLTPPRPTNILIDSTNRCNFRCVTCDQSFDQRFAQFDLSWYEIGQLTDFIRGARNLHLAGRGEPLLSPTVWEMIDAAADSRCTISMTTNGSILLRLGKLPKHAVKRMKVGISFDGGQKETVELIRKGFQWDKIRKNISSLPKQLKSRVVLAVTVNRINYSEIPAIAKLALELGVREINIQQFHAFLPWHTDMQMTSTEWQEMQNDIRRIKTDRHFRKIIIKDFSYEPSLREDTSREAMVSLKEKLAEVVPHSYRKDLSAEETFAEIKCFPAPQLPDFVQRTVKVLDLARDESSLTARPIELKGQKGPRTTKIPHCIAPWATMYLHSDGGIRPCCSIEAPMGSITEESLDEIWAGESYTLLREAMVSGRNLPGSCIGCKDSTRFAHLFEVISSILEESPKTQISPLFDELAQPAAVRNSIKAASSVHNLARVYLRRKLARFL